MLQLLIRFKSDDHKVVYERTKPEREPLKLLMPQRFTE